jgi:hypothetical protein
VYKEHHTIYVDLGHPFEASWFYTCVNCEHSGAVYSVATTMYHKYDDYGHAFKPGELFIVTSVVKYDIVDDRLKAELEYTRG